MNKTIQVPLSEEDINTLLSLESDELFFDLFEVMSSKESIASPYHLLDIS